MKYQLTKEYILENKGCYTKEQVESLSFINDKEITIFTVLDSEIHFYHKTWFLFEKCELTIREAQEIALACAESVEGIYSIKYPDDSRIKQCNEATRNYLDGKISLEELREKRQAAAAAVDDADAVDDDYAAYAAASAAFYAYAVDDDYAAYAAASAAFYAAASADVDDAAYAAASAAKVLQVIKDKVEELSTPDEE